jgi:hypothetical protein
MNPSAAESNRRTMRTLDEITDATDLPTAISEALHAIPNRG